MVILSDIGYHYLKRSSQSVTAGYVPEYFELSSRRICSMYEAYLKWGNISQEVINILGERYLRYILAGLVKSFDKRAKMKGKERKTWLQSVVRSDLYGNLSQVCTVGQKKLYVFQKVLNGKHLFMGIQIGKVIWLMREKFPVLFDKLRRYK